MDARCRHREGAVDIVRGSLTPRGGYNARRCEQRASVPITRVGAASPFGACGPRRVARYRPSFSVPHTREGIRKHCTAHKGLIPPLCAVRVA